MAYKNKEDAAKNSKKWRENNPEKHAAYKKWYRETHEKEVKNYYQENKERIKAQSRERYLKNKEKIKLQTRKRHLEKEYGISIEKYNELVTNQRGLCKICKKIPNKKLYIDHDHKTKKLRGLLCQNCNSAIGLLYEDINILQSAINYLFSYYSSQ